ncbi:putative serine/threonine protein kinase [Peziza echinospora]|nr:putative serine/threonine protein kinase [Peziza echinospora]
MLTCPKKTNRIVAIKSVMRAKLNRRLLENLESEISILTSLKHPHITRLKECIKSRAHIHLVMEFCSMGDLAGFIKNREKFSSQPGMSQFANLYPSPPGGGLHEVIVRHFLKQLASALAFLRAKQLIHRDLKPQNLLLSPPNYTGRSDDPDDEMENWDKLVGITVLPVLKIADFGFARELQVASLAETLCGSPLYMAPEILRYEKYDAKADLWSLGTVLFEMIAGRPPFRASNHVDLLRKIEEGNDRITFPSKCVASDDVKDLICGLLKRSPLVRMSFQQFFNHPAVMDEIPGAGVPQKSLKGDFPVSDTRRRESIVVQPEIPEQNVVQYDRDVVRYGGQNEEYQQQSREPERERKPSPAPAHVDPEPELPFALTPTAQAPQPPRPAVDQRRVTTPMSREPSSSRPGLPGHATAPARSEMVTHRISSSPVERRLSQNPPPSPGSPRVQYQQMIRPRVDRDPRSSAAQARERAENEILQEYVMIEKRSVEVNALADELAASPRVIPPPSPSTANAVMARRSNSGRGAPSSRPSSSGKPIAPQARSLEKKYGASPGSAATSALARALNLAPFRMFGMGSQKYSPPQHNQFPVYQTPSYPPGNMALVTASKPGATLSEEDQNIVNTLESCASKGDVVYHFAAVKYSQLVPMAPNLPQGQSMLPNTEGDLGLYDFDLTPEAIVVLSEQALVLYVKCISLLNKAMQIAGNWWRKTNQDPNGAYFKSHAAEKINGAVQWIRQRFNEAMEKADYVRLKLKEAQMRLPTSHPSHPCNHTQAEDSGRIQSDIFISPGVTAERLMFDRAIDMSRGAAVNELVGEDLEGCHMSYLTALKLVEAVLEVDDDEGNVDDDDRNYIETIVVNIKARVEAVKQKMAVHSKRSSGIHSIPSSPVPAYSPLYVNTPPK